MADKDPSDKSSPQTAAPQVAAPKAAAPASKIPVKNPRDNHPLNKFGGQRPGGHSFGPGGGFSPKPRARNMGRGR
jgi:hypothetical protein